MDGTKANKIKGLKGISRLTSPGIADTLHAMRRILPVLMLSLAAAAHAAPPDAAYEDMDALLAEKGLMYRLGSQFQQARDSVGEQASSLVINAMAFLGVPYRYGGNTVDTGFDCSGFVRYVYEQHGVAVPRQVRDQFRIGKNVDREDLEPGDLVFFSTIAPGASHVGIVIGGDQFVHAPSERGVVRVESLGAPYWASRYIGAKRVS